MMYTTRTCLIVLTLTASACADDATPPGKTACETNADCEPGELCDNGVCALLCIADTDCPATEACENGLCVAGGGACAADDDCGPPESVCELEPGVCVGGECQYRGAPITVACDDDDACTVSDHCNGIGGCTGDPRVCDQPPLPECGEGTLTLYDELGTCAEGDCSYDTSSFPCTGDCDDCMAACCLLRGCPQGDDPSTACVIEGGCDTATCECLNTLDPVGTSCDDSNPCTIVDACQACSADTPGCIAGRLCTGAEVGCAEPPECHQATGTCMTSCAGASGSCGPCTAPGCDWVCDYQPIADGALCTTALDAGVCVAGTCSTGFCSIGGQVYGSGTSNPSNGCEFCDPTRNQTGWSTVACESGGGGECRQPEGSCESTSSPGCTGQSCCVYAALWDGSGAAPDCGATGVCDTNGDCVGCATGADCDDANLCTTDVCNGNICENTALSSGVCDVTNTGDGMCVSGSCKLIDGQPCSEGPDCATGSCESDLCCPVGADCCESDASCNGAYACDGAAALCFTDCTTSAQCKVSGYCDGGCVDDKANGALCTDVDECLSGLCESGVCCAGGVDCCQSDSDCLGTIACDLTSRVCPTSCSGNDDGQCKAGHHCDGGACDPDRAQGEACDEDSDCSAGRCESLLCCAGTDDCCITDNDCAGLWGCNTATNICYDACSDDGDCKPAAHCGAGATCTSDLVDGATCSRDTQCESGRCDSSSCCAAGDDCCTVDLDCDSNFACASASGVCYDLCITDNECKTGLTCITGACGTGAANGTPCTIGAECLSGRCDAGFCCAGGDECCATSADCPGEYACDTGPNVCRTTCSDDTQCKDSGWCSSTSCVADLTLSNSCTRDQQCASDTCESGVCCGASADCCLVGDSDCTSATYGCDTAARECNTTCAGNGDCKSTAWCSGDACVARSDNGTSCTDGFECTSGNCVDEVCCNNSCTGTCRACDLVTSPGTCTDIPSGQDPDFECSLVTCKTGTCDGSGACGDQPANTACGTCKICDGGGSCGNVADGADPNNQCPNQECRTGDCNGLGACATRLDGSPCSGGEDCFGLCDNGVCDTGCPSVCCWMGCCASSLPMCSITCGPPP